jgi:hypothetical protein
LKRGELDHLEHIGHSRGLAITRQVRGAIYGTRHTAETNAGTAPDRDSFGRAPRSVWQGPTQIRSGAPVLRRNRPA